MAENIFASFDISSQGMSVQRMKLSAVANNIANVNTTKDIFGNPYQREVVVVNSVPENNFEFELNNEITLNRTDNSHAGNSISGSQLPDYTVLQASTVKDLSEPRLVYEPGHPDADDEGYVEYPNINIVTEMVDMISAQRVFQAISGVVQSAKNIARDAIDI